MIVVGWQAARYLWYPVRRGKPTAPLRSLDGTLEALSIFRATIT
jgi:hypothetical protein